MQTMTFSNTNGVSVSYTYDSDGNRVKKIVGGVTTQYLVDDLNPTGYPQVVEELTNGAVSRTYTYGLQRISEAQSINGTWTPSFYGYDGLGTVRQLTSSTGAITDTFDFDSFGNEVHSTGTTPNVYLYRGEQYDSDLGLYYLRARYYNPLTGRFMSRDPEEGKTWDPKSLHKYLYADGDPVNRLDPRGRAALVEVDLENAEIGFSSHGLDHLLAEGLEASEPEIEQFIEDAVREYIAEVQESGGNVGKIFDLMFTMEELSHIPWAARVFVMSDVLLQVSTYFPQRIP